MPRICTTSRKSNEAPLDRSALAVLDFITRAAGPVAVACFVVVLGEPDLADHVTGWHRTIYVVTGALIVAAAVFIQLDRATTHTRRRLYGRIHGPRAWSCPTCGVAVTATEYDENDAAVLDELLTNPAGHNCPAAQ